MKSTMDHLGKNMQCGQNRENVTPTPSNHFFYFEFLPISGQKNYKDENPLRKIHSS